MKRGYSGEDEKFTSFATINDRSMGISIMPVCDEYILCSAYGYFSEKDKKSRLEKYAIFVFDWELNPIKRFDLPISETGYYIISNDCKSVYICKDNEDGLALYKADLNI